MNENLKSELEAADPTRGSNQSDTHDLVRRMSDEAHRATVLDSSATRAPWWRRRRGVAGLAFAGALALTGAVVAIPLTMSVEGAPVKLDAEIPIAYTTDTGVDVTCEYGIYFGTPANRSETDELLANFVAEHDWAGIGQRIYERAIANPFSPDPSDDWEVDTQALRDKTSFIQASDLIWDEIPAEFQQDGQSANATMNCTGQLH